jgi:ATP-binding cassette subfamily C (CFTR/MRP) protein 1
VLSDITLSRLFTVHSRSGKSSLLMALFRAVEPSLIQGHVFVDGIDTKTLPLGKLRDSLRQVQFEPAGHVLNILFVCSLVSQSPFIWNATLRHNLDPPGIHTDEELWQTLERVGMRNAVSGLPDKLDTFLESDGGYFSSGQVSCLDACVYTITQRPFSGSGSSSALPESYCEKDRL